jgi:hypothetical protein
MGHNTAIKRYEVHPEGQAIDLFAAGVRSPVVAELLRAPWIARASDLLAERDGAGGQGAGAGKRVERPAKVEWDGERACPVSFSVPGRRRRYRVQAVVGHWVDERFWWDPDAHISRRCFRILVDTGALYDLAYDKLADVWLVTGIGD